MIHSLYVGGRSAQKIAARLSELGIPSYTDNRPNYRKWLGNKRRAEGTWSPSSVYAILKCETYAGIWRYGKNIGRRGKQERALDKQVEVAVPAIIDRGTWEAAQTTRE